MLNNAYLMSIYKKKSMSITSSHLPILQKKKVDICLINFLANLTNVMSFIYIILIFYFKIN